MKRSLFILALILGCDGGGSSDPDPVVTPTPIDAETVGTIKGKVVFSGTAPANPKLPVGGNPECSVHYNGPVTDPVVLVKNGRLQNVFVYVKSGLEKHVFAWPKTSARMGNEKCVYVPRVMGVQVHQPLEFWNGDPTDHNIHGFSVGGEFNFTLRGKDTTQIRKFRSRLGRGRLVRAQGPPAGRVRGRGVAREVRHEDFKSETRRQGVP
jgi:hypothetical protein